MLRAFGAGGWGRFGFVLPTPGETAQERVAGARLSQETSFPSLLLCTVALAPHRPGTGFREVQSWPPPPCVSPPPRPPCQWAEMCEALERLSTSTSRTVHRHNVRGRRGRSSAQTWPFLSAKRRVLQSARGGGGRREPIRFPERLSSCTLLHMNGGRLYEATQPRAKGLWTTPKGRRKPEAGAGGSNKGA